MLEGKQELFSAPDSPSEPYNVERPSKEDLQNELLYLKRMHWILRYHISLCYYMTQQFEEAAQV